MVHTGGGRVLRGGGGGAKFFFFRGRNVHQVVMSWHGCASSTCDTENQELDHSFTSICSLWLRALCH